MSLPTYFKSDVLPPKSEKPPYRMKQQRPKRRAEQRQINDLHAAQMALSNACRFRSPVCTRIATEPGHIVKQGQGGANTPRNQQPSCRACNDWIAESDDSGIAELTNQVRQAVDHAAAFKKAGGR